MSPAGPVRPAGPVIPTPGDPVRTRSVLLSAVLAVTALGGIAAEEAPEEPAPTPEICENENGFDVLSPGDLDVTVPAPNTFVGNERETQFFLVDLGTEEEPAFADTTASLSGEMTWTVVANDYDMVLGATTTADFQPVDPAVESATVTVRHCGLVEIGAIDFNAPAPVEELTISTTLSRNG